MAMTGEGRLGRATGYLPSIKSTRKSPADKAERKEEIENDDSDGGK
jgi:ABC-type glycerol-3-phosphate transport system substrate-binding protein